MGTLGLSNIMAITVVSTSTPAAAPDEQGEQIMTATPLTFTHAGDMAQALVSQNINSPQLQASVQLFWTGTPTAVIGVQTSSDEVHWDDRSFTGANPAVSQPAGAAGSCTINVPDFYEPFIRVICTPTSGCTGAVLSGNITLK